MKTLSKLQLCTLVALTVITSYLNAANESAGWKEPIKVPTIGALGIDWHDIIYNVIPVDNRQNMSLTSNQDKAWQVQQQMLALDGNKENQANHLAHLAQNGITGEDAVEKQREGYAFALVMQHLQARRQANPIAAEHDTSTTTGKKLNGQDLTGLDEAATVGVYVLKNMEEIVQTADALNKLRDASSAIENPKIIKDEHVAASTTYGSRAFNACPFVKMREHEKEQASKAAKASAQKAEAAGKSAAAAAAAASTLPVTQK
jgi:hypothetical protein